MLAVDQVARRPAISRAQRRALRVALRVLADQVAPVAQVDRVVVPVASAGPVVLPVVAAARLEQAVQVHLVPVVALRAAVVADAVRAPLVHSVAEGPRAKHASRSGRNVQSLSCARPHRWVA